MMVYEILTALNETFGCLGHDKSVEGIDIATQAQLKKAAEAMNLTVAEGCSIALNFLKHMQLCPWDVQGYDGSISNSMGVLATNITVPEAKAFEKELCKYEPAILSEKALIALWVVMGLIAFIGFGCMLIGSCKGKSCSQFFSRTKEPDAQPLMSVSSARLGNS